MKRRMSALVEAGDSIGISFSLRECREIKFITNCSKDYDKPK